MTATLMPPLSKSDALRAMVLADIRRLPSPWPSQEPMPGDVEVMHHGLEGLRRVGSVIDCRDGGAPFRFLLTQAALRTGQVTQFIGSQRLGERPHIPLFDALRGTGATIATNAISFWPVTVTAPEEVPRHIDFEVRGEQSSQFASSCLLGAARVVAGGGACIVRVGGQLASDGYFALSREWLAAFGFVARNEGTKWLVASTGKQEARRIPGDWSSIAYLLPLAWKSGAWVARVDLRAKHPDRAVVDALASIGLRVTPRPAQTPKAADSNEVRVVGTPTGGLDLDAAKTPDAIPALAALATVLHKPSRFRNCAILRLKESDRLEMTLELLGSAGIAARTEGDHLLILPGVARAFAFDSKQDHRMAMAAQVLAYLHGVPAEIRGRLSVAKSFPGFWKTVEQIKKQR